MSVLYCRNQDILVTEMDGDFVMMNVETGDYHSIRGSGVRIWELAETPVTEGQIVATRLMATATAWKTVPHFGQTAGSLLRS